MLSHLPNIVGGFDSDRLVANQPPSLLDAFTCAICSKIKKDAVAIQCDHSFCRECINRWALYNSSCPLCRAPFVPYVNLKPIENQEINITCQYNCSWQGKITDEKTHFETCVNSSAILKPKAYNPTICPLCDNGCNNVCLTCEVGLTEHQNCTWVILPQCNHGYHIECLLRWRRTRTCCKVCDVEIE